MTLCLQFLAALALNACSWDLAAVSDLVPPNTSTVDSDAGDEPLPTRTPYQPSPTPTRPTPTFVALPSPSATAIGTSPTRTDVLRVSVSSARSMADAGQAILVDVRPEAAYRAAHIDGSLSLPSDQISQRYTELPTGKLIIFYCA